MADRRPDAQLERFTNTGQGDRRSAAVEPVCVGVELAGLTTRLPPSLRPGTSSWSFPDWVEIVYGGPATAQRLARSGLTAVSNRKAEGSASLSAFALAAVSVAVAKT